MFQAFKGWWERGRKWPSEEFVFSANEETKHTPDLCFLEQSSLQLLFLPCELQSKHINGDVTNSGGVRLFVGFTLDNYQLYRRREDNQAIVLPGGEHRVKGEVWAIEPEYISELDKYKRNGVQSVRKRVNLLIPYSRGDKPTIHPLNTWFYESIPKFWDKHLDGGFAFPKATLYRPHNPFLRSFYFYHPNECKEK